MRGGHDSGPVQKITPRQRSINYTGAARGLLQQVEKVDGLIALLIRPASA